MGWTHGFGDHGYYENLPDYCGSIETAWEIVEKMDVFVIGKNKKKWLAAKNWENNIENLSEADTASMVICLAFLKLEEEKKWMN